MADNKAPEFIGREALTHVAEQVGKQIIMGPAYEDPELLDRLAVRRLVHPLKTRLAS